MRAHATQEQVVMQGLGTLQSLAGSAEGRKALVQALAARSCDHACPGLPADCPGVHAGPDPAAPVEAAAGTSTATIHRHVQTGMVACDLGAPL